MQESVQSRAAETDAAAVSQEVWLTLSFFLYVELFAPLLSPSELILHRQNFAKRRYQRLQWNGFTMISAAK